MSWRRIGSVNPRELWESRLQLHWAAQAAAGVGRSLLPKQPDFSQESFTWSPIHGALLQGIVDAPRPFRTGIRLRDMTLLLLNDRASVIDELSMNGRTLADGYAFFAARARALLGRDVTITPPPEGMPPHAVADGAAFQADLRHLEELERHYADAAEILGEVQQREEGASPIRCWPHHFDIATLITLAGSNEQARTVGIGMAPGDHSIREPYHYATPSPYPLPYPSESALPPFAHGRWNVDGWFGALLTASELASIPGDQQEQAVSQFVADAARHCRQFASQ